MRLDGWHDEAQACPLPHEELVELQRRAQKARLLLICLDTEMTWHGLHEGRPLVFSNAAIQFCLSIKSSACRSRRQVYVGMDYLNALFTMSNAPVSKDAPKVPHFNIIRMLCLTGW